MYTEYFPRATLASGKAGPNYWANSLVSALVADGCSLGDADQIFKEARALAEHGVDEPDSRFRAAVQRGFEKVIRNLGSQSEADEKAGRILSAAEKQFRLAMVCENACWFFWPYGGPGIENAGKYSREGRVAFRKAIAGNRLRHFSAEMVKIPYAGAELDGLFVPARGVSGPAPTVLHLNGMHSTLQWHFSLGIPQALAERGIASLLIDQPGGGETLHSLHIGARADTEAYVGLAVDYLQTRKDVDQERIGLLGGSLGGYRTIRALAFEPRVKAAVCFGAIYDVHIMPSDPAAYLALDPKDRPHYPVVGADPPSDWKYWTQKPTLAEAVEAMGELNVSKILPRVTVPLLVVHGEGDRQMPAEAARLVISGAVNSPKRELVLINDEMQGTEHCNVDNPNYVISVMADWMAGELGGTLG